MSSSNSDTLFLIDAGYKWVLLAASVICFHFIITGFIVGGKRGKTFNKEYLETNFRLEHEEFYPGGKIAGGGYPDMGNGRYSDKLTYKEWFEFNSAQRIHYNYLESIAAVIAWILIGGLYFAWITFGFACVYLVSRIIYHVRYQSKGPDGRYIAVVLIYICHIAFIVLSIMSPIYVWNNRIVFPAK